MLKGFGKESFRQTCKKKASEQKVRRLLFPLSP